MIVIFIRKAFLPVIYVDVWISSSVVLDSNNDLALVTIYLINIVLVVSLFNDAVNAPLRQQDLYVNVRYQIVLAQPSSHLSMNANQYGAFGLLSVI